MLLLIATVLSLALCAAAMAVQMSDSAEGR
jgi:hypothetical protein